MALVDIAPGLSNAQIASKVIELDLIRVTMPVMLGNRKLKVPHTLIETRTNEFDRMHQTAHDVTEFLKLFGFELRKHYRIHPHTTLNRETLRYRTRVVWKDKNTALLAKLKLAEYIHG